MTRRLYAVTAMAVAACGMAMSSTKKSDEVIIIQSADAYVSTSVYMKPAAGYLNFNMRHSKKETHLHGSR